MHLRQDYRKIASIYGDARAEERIVAHYELERRLADEMRLSTRTERDHGLYTRLYDQLIQGLDDHPRRRAETEEGRARKRLYVEHQRRMICHEVHAQDVFLDVGGGDCAVALAVAPHVARAIVVDVSDALVPAAHGVDNFSFVRTAGVSVPLESERVSFVYSNQLIEHLHPQDARDQLRELHRVLKPGGRYMCRTPNRVTGPHDVSRYFDEVAHGTHMKEYTYAELAALFAEAGFVRARVLIAPRAQRLLALPSAAAVQLERFFERVPRRLHTAICRSVAVRTLLGITMIAEKPQA